MFDLPVFGLIWSTSGVRFGLRRSKDQGEGTSIAWCGFGRHMPETLLGLVRSSGVVTSPQLDAREEVSGDDQAGPQPGHSEVLSGRQSSFV